MDNRKFAQNFPSNGQPGRLSVYPGAEILHATRLMKSR